MPIECSTGAVTAGKGGKEADMIVSSRIGRKSRESLTEEVTFQQSQRMRIFQEGKMCNVGKQREQQCIKKKKKMRCGTGLLPGAVSCTA